VIARREYRERIRSRLFVGSTMILMTIATFVALSPLAIRAASVGQTATIEVVSNDAPLAERTLGHLDRTLNIPPPGVDPAVWQKPYRVRVGESAERAREAVVDAEIDGALIAERQPSGGISFTFLSLAPGASQAGQLVQVGALVTAIDDWQAALPRTGLGVFQPPTIDAVNPVAATEGGAAIDAEAAANRTIIALAFEFLIFMSLVIYGMWVAQGVAAEKSSRVMELMISAASPVQLLVGKVLGLGAAGLSQYALVVGPAFLILLVQTPLADLLLGPGRFGESTISGLTPPLLLAYGAFFLLGFVFYALIYASVGSLASRPDDLQVVSFPLALIPLVGYLFALLAITGSGSRLIATASFIPLFTPFVMLARLVVGRVEPWEIAASLGVLVLSIVVMTWLAIRVYSAGVLLYGQRPSLRGFIAAARTPR
jgi:ABC-2 type transport system permease protein